MGDTSGVGVLRKESFEAYTVSQHIDNGMIPCLGY